MANISQALVAKPTSRVTRAVVERRIIEVGHEDAFLIHHIGLVAETFAALADAIAGPTVAVVLRGQYLH